MKTAYIAAIVCAIAIVAGAGIGTAVQMRGEAGAASAFTAPVRAIQVEGPSDGRIAECTRITLDGNETVACAPIFTVAYAGNGTGNLTPFPGAIAAKAITCETEETGDGMLAIRCEGEGKTQEFELKTMGAAQAHPMVFVHGEAMPIPDESCERTTTDDGNVLVRCERKAYLPAERAQRPSAAEE